MNIFTAISPGRLVSRRMFTASSFFLDSGLYSRRMPSQPSAFSLPFIRSYSRKTGADTKKTDYSFIKSRSFMKRADDRIRLFDPAVDYCVRLFRGRMTYRPREDINDSNAFSSGGTIEMMGNVVATYSILGEWDMSDMQAYADHTDYLPHLYEELMATIQTHTPTSLPYKTVFGIICDFEKGSVYRYDHATKKIYPGPSVYFDKSKDASFVEWFFSEFLGILMHQYTFTLQARTEICQDPEERAKWQCKVDLANRAYDLLTKKPVDPIEHKKDFNETLTLVERSTTQWPESPR
ncbi:uncharacterized protein EV420DRAFT_1585976 [Desarmillaria tabescens]|uniref:Uncharacterized protein n=1 Tax=Armillaria tabescens TaxID=1929756 RepID=A0AA39J8Z5_ARMTA|nr:uncharacterized protein EV420DRAFT_1585976 [Desarmillaria tabescens]KAK0438355.1 hypothetical protein EV420DRAFT_1585976 [Desarmillaria tabescens]